MRVIVPGAFGFKAREKKRRNPTHCASSPIIQNANVTSDSIRRSNCFFRLRYCFGSPEVPSRSTGDPGPHTGVLFKLMIAGWTSLRELISTKMFDSNRGHDFSEADIDNHEHNVCRIAIAVSSPFFG